MICFIILTMYRVYSRYRRSLEIFFLMHLRADYFHCQWICSLFDQSIVDYQSWWCPTTHLIFPRARETVVVLKCLVLSKTSVLSMYHHVSYSNHIWEAEIRTFGIFAWKKMTKKQWFHFQKYRFIFFGSTEQLIVHCFCYTCCYSYDMH